MQPAPRDQENNQVNNPRKKPRKQPRKQRKQGRKRVDYKRDVDNKAKLRLDSWILQPVLHDQESNVERESTV